MPKRLKLEPHQTPSELSKLYRQASDLIERTRYQIIWLLATGRVTEDVASVTGYCRNSIYRLVRRYNQLGANGLKDKRHQHPGTQPLLSVVEQAQLLQTLQAPPADGGLWNSRKDKHIILAIDQAGWHTSPQVRFPEGLHLEFMPSHSPELQPAERLWPLVNEPIANRSFQNLDELEEVLFQRCQALLKQPSLIKGIACFHWWPKTKAISFRCNRN